MSEAQAGVLSWVADERIRNISYILYGCLNGLCIVSQCLSSRDGYGSRDCPSLNEHCYSSLFEML